MMSSAGVQSLSAMRAEAVVRGCVEWSSSTLLPQQPKTAHTEPVWYIQPSPKPTMVKHSSSQSSR